MRLSELVGISVNDYIKSTDPKTGVTYSFLKVIGKGNKERVIYLPPHKLMHTAATLMYQNGVDVRILKEVLGHENLNTTQIYTHVSDNQIKQAMDQNPLSGIEAPRSKKNNEA